MKIQRHLSHKRGDKIYHKYVVVLPDNLIKDSGFQEGDELEAEAKKGEIRLKRREKGK
jgi:antitoxin component of MazEF toxin-antitoxin module